MATWLARAEGSRKRLTPRVLDLHNPMGANPTHTAISTAKAADDGTSMRTSADNG
jgi:hypothetical protein